MSSTPEQLDKIKSDFVNTVSDLHNQVDGLMTDLANRRHSFGDIASCILWLSFARSKIKAARMILRENPPA